MNEARRLDALAAAWPLIAETYPRPWPEEVCRLDLAMLVDRSTHPTRPEPLPGRRDLARRWGVSDWTARTLLRELGVDSPASLPRPSRSSPASLPLAQEPTPGISENSPAPLPPPSRVPPASLHTRVETARLPAPSSQLPEDKEPHAPAAPAPTGTLFAIAPEPEKRAPKAKPGAEDIARVWDYIRQRHPLAGESPAPRHPICEAVRQLGVDRVLLMVDWLEECQDGTPAWARDHKQTVLKPWPWRSEVRAAHSEEAAAWAARGRVSSTRGPPGRRRPQAESLDEFMAGFEGGNGTIIDAEAM